jgi:hypothetical protein
MKSSIQYNGTEHILLNETFNGLPFFRKNIGAIEYMIYQILMENPHPNLVKVYRLTKTFVDMELLTPVNDLEEYDETSILMAAHEAKDHLQGIGIFYIDWKSDNLGVTEKGNYRLFDFDGSGIFQEEWIIEPLPYWSYRQAQEKGLKVPKEIDDFAFDLNLRIDKNKT